MADSFLSGEARSYSYYAFISYRHKDGACAVWLQRQLEWYRLPNRLVSDRKLPKRLTPVFRDSTDLSAGGTVYDLLQEKLATSKYLIVICSRNVAASPKYIDYEIEQFLALGNPASRILPFIIDGEANAADPAMECLPPALKRMGENIPLGVTLDRRSKRDAVLKLVAAMLEIELQIMRDHDKRRRQRVTVLWLSAGLCVTTVLGVSMAWEALSVKQAQLREQNTYSAAAFHQGNRLQSGALARAVALDQSPFLDPDILEEADELDAVSALWPKYSPCASLCDYAENSRVVFDADGSRFSIQTPSAVLRFDRQGSPVGRFDTAGHGQRIVAACGDYAVTMTIFSDEARGSALWLWRISDDTRLALLVSSEVYSNEQSSTGSMTDVVDACFSPDGTLLCAYRADSYFNVSDELALFSAETGEKVLSLPAELLGDMNQGAVIQRFEFVGDHTAHWTSAAAHVYAAPEWEQPLVVSTREVSDHVMMNSERYAFAQAENGSLLCVDLARGTQLELSLADGEWIPAQEVLCTPRYGWVPVMDARDKTSRVLLIDLETMTLLDLPSMRAGVCQGYDSLRLVRAEGSERVYALLEGRAQSLFGEEAVSRMFWLDPDARTCHQLRLNQRLTGEPPAAILANGDTDLLVYETQIGALLLERRGSVLRQYRLAESAQALLRAIALPGDELGFVALHNNEYYLYAAREAGQAMEPLSQPTGQPLWACGADGGVVLKADAARLTRWEEGAMVWEQTMDAELLSLQTTEDGARTLLATQSELRVLDGEGAALVSLTQDDPDCTFVSARLSGDGARVAVLERVKGHLHVTLAEDGGYSVQDTLHYRLRLLDGETLREISILHDAVYDNGQSPDRLYDLSADGQYVSAVVQVWKGEQFMRAAALWSAHDGELLGATNNTGRVENVLNFDVTVSPIDGYAFSYVQFTQESLLMTGMARSLWVFDPRTGAAVGSLSESDAITDAPALLNGSLLFPADAVHVWNLTQGELVATLSQGGAGTDEWMDSAPYGDEASAADGAAALSGFAPRTRLTVSDDGKWVTVAGEHGTALYRTRDWKYLGNLSNRPVEVLRLSREQIVYDTGEALYQIKRETGEEES